MYGEDRLILVDLTDRPIGEAGKMEAHRKGLLHRAFSAFLYDGDRLFLQKRAAWGVPFRGLWANTCCSHPRVGESLEEAVQRRLREETGVSCPVSRLTSFVYRAVFPETGLCEYELDHLFVGRYAGPFDPDPGEIEAMESVPMGQIAEDLCRRPERYAPWFVTAFPMVYRHLMLQGENEV